MYTMQRPDLAGHEKSWTFTLSRVSLTALSALLIGCGGGGGGAPNSSNAVPKNTVSGVVLDGYLQGAKVCLDLNDNWLCDVDEPYAMSQQKGAYQIDIGQYTPESVASKRIIAEVGADAYDEDAGKTLRDMGQAGGYTLAAWASKQAVLSPITTMNVGAQINKGLFDIQETAAYSPDFQQNELSGYMGDYFNSSLSPSEREKAKATGRILAAALHQAKALLQKNSPTTAGGTGMGHGLRATDLVWQALNNTRPPSASENENERLVRLKESLSVIPLATGSDEFSQRMRRMVTASAAMTILNDGLFNIETISDTPRSFLKMQAQGNKGQFSVAFRQYSNANWVNDDQYKKQGVGGYHVMAFTTPYLTSDFSLSSVNTPILELNGETILEKWNATGAQNQLQLLEVDVSGLSFKTIPALGQMEGVFPPDTKAYKLRRAQMNLNSPYVILDSLASFFTKYESFIGSPRSCDGGICWSINRTDKTIEFSTTSDAQGNRQVLGAGTFIESIKNGIPAMYITAIPIAVQNRSTLWTMKEGLAPVFAEMDGQLWIGRLVMRQPHDGVTASVWYSPWLIKKSTLNSVLQTQQLTQIP